MLVNCNLIKYFNYALLVSWQPHHRIFVGLFLIKTQLLIENYFHCFECMFISNVGDAFYNLKTLKSVVYGA